MTLGYSSRTIAQGHRPHEIARPLDLPDDELAEFVADLEQEERQQQQEEAAPRSGAWRGWCPRWPRQATTVDRHG